MNIKKISQLFVQINTLTPDEYKEFRAGLVRLDKQMQARAMDEFRIGDIVQFQSSKRRHGYRYITIKVTGKGPKRLQGVEVDPRRGNKEMGMTWKVPAGMCTKMTEEVQS